MCHNIEEYISDHYEGMRVYSTGFQMCIAGALHHVTRLQTMHVRFMTLYVL